MPAPNAQNLLQMNIGRRMALLASSPRFRKDLGINTQGALNGNTRIKLYNVGILTGILLSVTTTIDITTGATVSAGGPFNLINRLRLTDYDGTDRVNVSGDELFMINCIRGQEYIGYANNLGGSVFSTPVVPTGAGAGQAMQFFIYVPVAFSPESDLRGAMLMQTSVGEVYLNIDWNSLYVNTVGADHTKPFSSTTAIIQNAGTTINVQAWQDYLLPQAVDGQNQPILPTFDLLTVYELNGGIRSFDNLAAATEKLVNFPNVRSVVGMYLKYINGGIANAGTDITKLRVIANGNNVLSEESALAHAYQMRLWCNSMDLRAGYYPFLFRGRPVETSQYGNMQVGFTPSSVTANTQPTFLGVCTESFYTKGATLPGMLQASG